MKSFLLFASILLLSGCANMGYYLQAVRGQMDVTRRAQPIERMLADSTVADSLKRDLREVRRIREFASKELALPDNGTFQRYADLQRAFAVWNVFAAQEFSIQPKEWCYLLFGCVNYRGYFSHSDAEAAAQVLQQDGYETYVSGIPAYSTLGWFDDPVLNTFIHYPEGQLAALMFHELAHQVVYVFNDTTFNESFAATVAQEGAHRWLARYGTEEQRTGFELFQRRKQNFIALVHKYRARLAEIYTATLSDDEKRVRKADAFHAMREQYRILSSTWGGATAYDTWFDRPLNNAQLASVSLYTQMVPAFQSLLAREGGDLPRFYRAVKEIAALPKEERLSALQTGFDAIPRSEPIRRSRSDLR